MPIALQIGQCGNQLADAVWRALETSVENPAEHPFVTNELLNTACIDAEPKVVRRLLAAPPKFPYRKEFTAYAQGGSANNFALGYYGCEDKNGRFSDSLLEIMETSVQRLCDRCDSSDLFVFHSLAGGTGSGISARVFESAKGDWGIRSMTSVCVAPFIAGEVAVQHFNASFCMNAIQSNCDACIYTTNDSLLQRMTAVNATKSAAKAISMSNLNQHAAKAIASVFCPAARFDHCVETLEPKASESESRRGWILSSSGLSNLCPSPGSQEWLAPSCPLLDLTHSQSKAPKWADFSASIQKWCRAKDFAAPEGYMLRFATCLSPSSALFIRGVASKVPDGPLRKEDEDTIVNKLSIGAVAKHHAPFHGVNRAATLVRHCAAPYAQVMHSMQRAEELMDVGAYTHWYMRFGMEEEDMRSRLDNLAGSLQL